MDRSPDIQPLVWKCGTAVLTIDTERGILLGLQNSVTGNCWVPEAGVGPLFELVGYTQAGRRVQILPSNLMHIEQHSNRLALFYKPLPAITVCVKITSSLANLTTPAGSTIWRITITNAAKVTAAHKALDVELPADAAKPAVADDAAKPRVAADAASNCPREPDPADGYITIAEVLFPCIRGLAPSPDLGTDYLVFPHHAGERCADPRTEYRSERYQSFWRANTVQKNDQLYVREIPYCGLASMMWMDYFTASGGVYLASYDHDFLLTGLRVEVTAGSTSDWTLGLALRKYLPIPPGVTWNSAPFVLWLHPDDWHVPARAYRQWFTTCGLPHYEPVPNDMANEVVVTPRYDLKRDGHIRHTFIELFQLHQQAAEKWGSHHLFLAGWNQGGFDSQYPEYHPDLELGTPLALQQAVQQVNAADGWVTFYINSRLFDQKSAYHATLGQSWAIRTEQGETCTETYGPVKFDVCCPAHPGWQAYLADIAQWMVQSYGARGIYLDQLGSATPFACYGNEHGHTVAVGTDKVTMRKQPTVAGQRTASDASSAAAAPDSADTAHHITNAVVHHGRYNQGYTHLLDDVTQRVRSGRDDTFLMIENCGDLYSTRVWGSLAWNGAVYDEFFRMFKYTFPQCTLLQMIQPRTAVAPEQKLAQYRRDLNEAWLLGSVFWIHPPRLEQPIGVTPNNAHEMVLAAQTVLALKRIVQPLLAKAVFVDTDNLEALFAPAQPGGIGEYATHWVIDVRQEDANLPVPHIVLTLPGGMPSCTATESAADKTATPVLRKLRVRVQGSRPGARDWYWRRHSVSLTDTSVHTVTGQVRADARGWVTLPLVADRSSAELQGRWGCWEAWELWPSHLYNRQTDTGGD